MAQENERIQAIRAANRPALSDETTLALRAITEKRALTMTLMLDKAKAMGLSEQFTEQAIYEYGVENGNDFKNALKNSSDLKEFADLFLHNLEANVYEMEEVIATDDEFRVHFHYCPYVNRWLRMGKTADEMAHLCDLCMIGDRAMIEGNFKTIQFVLGNTIAKGNDVCDIRFYKKDPD